VNISKGNKFNKAALSSLAKTWVPRSSLIIILVFFIAYLPKILNQSQKIDDQWNGIIPGPDDSSYQILALNLLHGQGFSDFIHLPFEQYRIQHVPGLVGKELSEVTLEQQYSFFRSPGLPVLLGTTYAILGEDVLNARRMIGLLIWFTAVLLVLEGSLLAGWLGAIAGGLTGYYYMNYGGGVVGETSFTGGHILSEPASAFWLALFTVFFTIYHKKKLAINLYLAAIPLLAFLFTRSNFLLVLPLLYMYIWFIARSRKKLTTFILITAIPLLAWSLYASTTVNKLILMNTQSETFPLWNNMDVITGVGPDKLGQGNISEGYVINDSGNIIKTMNNAPKPGENPWLKGFQFWIQNPEKLPQLFYAKLRSSLWYRIPPNALEFPDVRVYLFGISLLLVSIGFRPPNKRFNLFDQLTPRESLIIQLGLATLLLIIGDNGPFYQILLIWGAILVIAIFQPYGDTYKPDICIPTWFLLFIAAYLLPTLLFGGYFRFHFPIDPTIRLFGALGLMVVIFELLKSNLWLGLIYLTITAQSLYRVFEYAIRRVLQVVL